MSLSLYTKTTMIISAVFGTKLKHINPDNPEYTGRDPRFLADAG
jgi:hypothetical protein